MYCPRPRPLLRVSVLRDYSIRIIILHIIFLTFKAIHFLEVSNNRDFTAILLSRHNCGGRPFSINIGSGNESSHEFHEL